MQIIEDIKRKLAGKSKEAAELAKEAARAERESPLARARVAAAEVKQLEGEFAAAERAKLATERDAIVAELATDAVGKELEAREAAAWEAVIDVRTQRIQHIAERNAKWDEVERLNHRLGGAVSAYPTFESVHGFKVAKLVRDYMVTLPMGQVRDFALSIVRFLDPPRGFNHF